MRKISLFYGLLVLTSCSLSNQNNRDSTVFKGNDFSIELKNNGDFLIRENKVFGDSWNGVTALKNDSIILAFCTKYSCDNLIISLNQDSTPSKNSKLESQYCLQIEGSEQFEQWYYMLEISTDSIYYRTIASGYGDPDLKSIIYWIDRNKLEGDIFFKFRIMELKNDGCIKAAVLNSRAIDIAKLNNGLYLNLSGDFNDDETCEKIYAQIINKGKAIVLDSNCAIAKDIILYKIR
jgi:hypothetical protein